jgi:hypothetical protein
VHSFCTSGKCFSIARRNIRGQSGFSEYVAILKACQWMIAVTPVADWQFSEGELPGEIRKRARVRAGCPGIAASSTSPLLSGLGSWLGARVAEK